ncbi:uncharacterized protein DUF2782 [Luteibacter rhizovicinus]|uniref:Uncharacterized protein DUF2782 n=1 Tax=Luteibacter rhizovicinus TaxID=242606 RepID=A0A4R3YU20_9GAMM|nr:DUF2782 domain-containing protein [Luteibacter rhizovicinus]TCV96051.1 uncharacterized protein DUF2782 [Luteibacter rhizovicinus]
MKRIAPVLAAALALAATLPAAAQDSTKKPEYKPGLPPPTLNDPGVKAGEKDRSGAAEIPRPVPYDSAEAGQTTPATTDAQPAPRSSTALPEMRDNGGSNDRRGQPPPQVTVRQQGEDRVEEYRTGGKLFMVVVTPKNGVPQTYMADQNGKLYHDPKDGPVSPVYYKVYEWGAAPKPAGQ